MSFYETGLEGIQSHGLFPNLYRVESSQLALSCLSLLVLMGALVAASGNAALAQPQREPLLLAAAGSSATIQAQGMAGYVLNAETNMNTVYTRKLNRELLDPNHSKIDDSPVIQYQGPPPQVPPIGPLRLGPTAP